MRRRLPSLEESREILAAKRSRPPRRPPPPAGAALARTLKGLDARFGKGAGGGGGAASVGPLAARWREVAGELLSRRTEPARLIRPRGRTAAEGGATLEVRVDGPAASLVQHQAPDILARANLVLGAGAVTRLRIVQGPVRPPAQALAPKPPRRRLAAPLDAAAEAELERGLAEVGEGSLRAALLRLGRATLREG